MIRKIIGIVLITISIFLIAAFIANGLLFPHLSGPLVIGVAGILTLTLGKH